MKEVITEREAYIYGWIYGRLDAAMGYKYSARHDMQLACMRPLTAGANILNEAARRRLLKDELDDQIRDAMNQIDSIPTPTGGPESVVPSSQQGAWQLGFYAGKSLRPMNPPRQP